MSIRITGRVLPTGNVRLNTNSPVPFLNWVANNNSVISNNGRTVSVTGLRTANATQPLPATGKYYWEVTSTGFGLAGAGPAVGSQSQQYPGAYTNSAGMYALDNTVYVLGNVTGARLLTTGAGAGIIGMAFDAATRTLDFYRGGLKVGFSTFGGSFQLFPIVGNGGTSTTSIISMPAAAGQFVQAIPAGYVGLPGY